MNFSEALKAMKMGSKVSREAWRGTISYLQMFFNEHDNTHEINEFFPDNSSVVVDGIDTEDILAEDWWIVT